MTDDRLATALAAERAILRRGARDSHEIVGGWVIRDDGRPDLWHVNRVLLTGDASALAPTAIAALTDRWLADRPHRRLTLDDALAAEALWPVLEARHWDRERAVVMVLGDEAAVPAWPRRMGEIEVGQISEAELARFQPEAFAQDAGIAALGADLPGRIASMQAALRGGTPARGYGAHLGDGEPSQSAATLYLDPDVGGRRVAFIDQVVTLRPFRERGLGGAVVRAAIADADAWGADLVALLADADDWPQVMYAEMGFVAVGRQVTVHRAAAA